MAVGFVPGFVARPLSRLFEVMVIVFAGWLIVSWPFGAFATPAAIAVELAQLAVVATVVVRLRRWKPRGQREPQPTDTAELG